MEMHDSVASDSELDSSKHTENFPFIEMKQLYITKLSDISFDVRAACFNIIATKDSSLASDLTTLHEKDSGSAVMNEISRFYAENSLQDKTDFFLKAIYTSKSRERYEVIK